VRRFFVTNLLFVIVVNALVKPAYVLGVDRVVQVRVGPASYGIYQALVNLGLIFNVLLDFGLANYNVRMVAAAPDQLPERMPPLLTARLVLSAGFGVIVFLTALLLGYRGAQLGLLAGILLIQCLAQAHLFFRSCLSGLHQFKADSLLSVTDRVLLIGLCTILLQLPGFALSWFVGAQIGCYAIALIIGMMLVKRFSALRYRLSLNLQPVWKAMRATLPYALCAFLMSIYLRADAMLIERMAGATEAGRYAAAYRLLDVGHMFGLTFASLLLPLYGKLFSEQKTVRPLVVTSVNLLLPVSFIVAAIGLFYALPVMELLYGDHGRSNAPLSEAPIFTVLMTAFPAFCLSNIYSTLFAAQGSLKIQNRIAAVGCVISLAANLVLISPYKSVGAAWATCITQWVVAGAYVWYSSRMAGLPFTGRWVGLLVVYAVLAVVLGYGSTFLPVKWMYQIGIYGIAMIGLLVVLGLVSPRSLKQLMVR
jgi:O-antigen/teichoic acid export membrane protein